jgi:penicillin-binding protein 2
MSPANNWVDLSKLETGDNYFSSDEYYKKLIAYTKNILKSDAKFEKMIYRNLIFSYKLTGNEICLLLFDQGVLKYNKDEVAGLKAGNISSYNFMIDKIKKLEITPAMLALDPCTGSVVITDVNTGDVLALVSYPGYDNNKFSGKIDSKYFNKVNTDLSEPLRNKPTAVKTPPGSTFKMVTSVAALQEGVVTPSYKVYDEREFTKIFPSPKCNAYPSSHGDVDLANALSVSCNYYFFEMGWRLSLTGSGKYDSDFGLKRLKKYASLFGLNKASGIELPEAEPQISDWDAVRSAIGQGHNLFTPVQMSRYVTTIANRGTCYNLTLLNKETRNNGTLVKKYGASVDHTLKNISTTTWDAVYNGMFDVVNAANGSVTSIFKGLGVTVAGKTGTSQINVDTPNNALFVSFAPYNNPKISVTAVIPKGYTSHNAAALAKNIYALYFNLQDKKTLLESEISASGNSTNGAIE